ncbi:hypothetical protein HBB16_18665 [Pseudonocardia sp. MCCB 268]|nr:hypothetical protein [Pseudonocardia cytotoxica]
MLGAACSPRGSRQRRDGRPGLVVMFLAVLVFVALTVVLHRRVRADGTDAGTSTPGVRDRAS